MMVSCTKLQSRYARPAVQSTRGGKRGEHSGYAGVVSRLQITESARSRLSARSSSSLSTDIASSGRIASPNPSADLFFAGWIRLVEWKD